MSKVPPEYVYRVIRCLESAGFSAHLVGGCVRDLILGRRPKDWDVCTDALPETVTELFPNSRPTGIRHGTVTVISRGSAVEITTYRTDGAYLDHRRPDKVEFITDLRGDLARRDFTMNAMAMTASGELLDPFGGRTDLGLGLIRCVGEPDKRFEEDALRMLRALRFSAVLGFEIEKETMAAINRNAALIEHVAPERVSAELEKALLSERPEFAAKMLELRSPELPCEPADDFLRIKYLPKKLSPRLAALLAVYARRGQLAEPEALLLSLRLSSQTVKHASAGCLLALEQVPPVTPAMIKRLVAGSGDDTAACAAAALYALWGGGVMRTFRAVISSGECFRLSELAITGDELTEMGFSGKAVGNTLRELLEHVIINPRDNDRKTLTRLAKKAITTRN